MIRHPCPWLLLLFAWFYSSILLAQVQPLGTIAGQLRTSNGDSPSHQIMVEVRLHGATVNSAYTDAQGRFSFANLDPDSYQVIIRDDAYSPVDELVSLRPESPVANLRIFLRPHEQTTEADPVRSRPSGANPFVVNPSDYNAHFPKKAIKEYQRGVEADRGGNREHAITNYQAALKLAPDYYPAHNNLGSDYLAKSDLDGARKEFEEVVRLNQSDAAGYFNLSNVCMLTGKLDEAKQNLDEGLRREPDSALGYFLLGSLDMRTGKYQDAEGALRQAVQVSPAMTQARLQLINLLMKLGRNSEAQTELQNFIKAFPDNVFTPKARQLLQHLEGPTSTNVVNQK